MVMELLLIGKFLFLGIITLHKFATLKKYFLFNCCPILLRCGFPVKRLKLQKINVKCQSWIYWFISDIKRHVLAVLSSTDMLYVWILFYSMYYKSIKVTDFVLTDYLIKRDINQYDEYFFTALKLHCLSCSQSKLPFGKGIYL